MGRTADGNLVQGAEVRSVEREHDYLVYACNLTGKKVEFDLKGAGDGEILELRSMTVAHDDHIVLQPYQETLFRIEKNP